MAKKVVYLLGSGATQGVVRHAENRSLLTKDIQDYIRDELSANSQDFSDKIWNEIVIDGRDVEHLITVLDTQYKYDTADTVRRFYQDAIVTLAGRLTQPLSNNLYTYLVDLHLRSPRLLEKETLTCFLSLNYEDLLERSIEGHIPNVVVDYGLTTTNVPDRAGDSIVVPVLKLHGSFNWINTRPVELGDMGKISSNRTLWIPPGIDKKRENYPFNLLWGKAVEYIQGADTIRIIGCSLSRNDWGLIPIIYVAQSLSTNTDLTIELIDYAGSTASTVNNYRYLQFTEFIDLPEIKTYKPRGTTLTRESAANYFDISNVNEVNIFESWLNAKIESLYTIDGVMRDDILSKDPAELVASYYTNSK